MKIYLLVMAPMLYTGQSDAQFDASFVSEYPILAKGLSDTPNLRIEGLTNTTITGCIDNPTQEEVSRIESVASAVAAEFAEKTPPSHRIPLYKVAVVREYSL